MLRAVNSERGASAILIALSLLVLLGFAAIAIDLSVGFNQRRQDQTAADVGVMAGAIETLGPNTKIRDLILDFTRRNVVADYSAADWQALWEACQDPERLDLNASGFMFQPIVAPAGWSTATGNLDCISFDGGGFVRVNLPDLPFETTFGQLLGVDELEANADAVARMGNRGGGGILPFGLVSTAGEGQHPACVTPPAAMPRSHAMAPTPATSAHSNHPITAPNPTVQAKTAPAVPSRTSSQSTSPTASTTASSPMPTGSWPTRYKTRAATWTTASRPTP